MSKLGVPLSQPPMHGTAGQSALSRDTSRDTGGTASLKALALRALSRGGLRDSAGTPDNISVPTMIEPLGHLPRAVPTVPGVPRVPAVPDVPVDPAIDEERAAFIEYEAGVPRAWSEGFAKLGTMPRPAGVLPKDWLKLVDNAGLFIDRFAHQAAALGWTTESIFGCHPAAPIARLDLAGLIWLIGDGEIIAITTMTAKIRTQGGAILTYQRHEPTPGEPQVAAWALA
jgi:hypothetical protein